MDEEAVLLAMIAHIRHAETEYDELIARGHDRSDARAEVQGAIFEILKKWQGREMN